MTYMLHWAIPKVTATFRVKVPEIILYAPADGFEEWKACREAFHRGGCTEPACLGRFEPLLDRKRLGSFWDPRFSLGYGEAETALALVQDGYEAWTGIQLFPFLRRNVVSEERVRKLAEVDERLERCRLPRPRDIMQYANFRPKNPDVVAFEPTLGYFRFSEVKRGTHRPHQNQVKALGLLHVITGAPVAITRVVNGRTETRPMSYVAEFAYEGPSWHVSWGGLSWFDDDGSPDDPWLSKPG